MAPEPSSAPDRLPLESLPAAILDRLRQLARLTNGRAWLVGGPVRDALLGRPLIDFDLVVEADAAAVATQLPAQLLKTTAFGTATVQWPDGSEWDIAGARAERYPLPGSLPVCRPATLAEDLARRDFTINALAASLEAESWGAVVDLHNGLQDLQDHVIRALHDRSFDDDPTRLFRAARYAARLGFKLHPKTAAQAAAAVDDGRVNALTPARILHELERSLGEHPATMQILALAELGLWDAIAAGLEIDKARLTRLDRGLSTRTEPLAWATRLAALLPHDEPVAAAHRLMERLHPSRPAMDVVEQVADKLAAGPWLDDARPSRVAAELDRLTDAALPALAAHWPALHNAVQLYRARWREARPELNGHELRELGVPEGPPTGAALRGLRDARLDGEVTNRHDEIGWVGRWLEERTADG